jgi:uncharacterized protein YecE (DUF72 family)
LRSRTPPCGRESRRSPPDSCSSVSTVPQRLYASSYGSDALGRWADRLRRWNTGGEPDDALRLTARKPPQRLGRDVYVYFDNTAGGHAVREAMILRRLFEP